ncbi:MAG: transcriptional repressor [Eubacteriales bacterium]|nr:transcriptional repressor [Eubacteriales bacterium]
MTKEHHYATASRRKILEILKENKDRTVTAAEIGEWLRRMENDVNITTVYRYLDKLEKDGTVIRYAPREGGRASYQYVEQGKGCENHLHMKCGVCGRIYHLDCAFMEEIAEHIQKDHGFTLSCRDSILYGTCRDCRTSGLS